jgi:hypothetical protein
MTGEELFVLWAPQPGTLETGSPEWCSWAKPVLFADMGDIPAADPADTYAAFRDDRPPDVSPQDRWAIIVDLPGAQSVEAGLALADKGWVPVPLFNAGSSPGAIIEMQPVKDALIRGAARLRTMRFNGDAPPVFLLDSRRIGGVSPKPGDFDNRWIVLPQDFPSANLLISSGIGRALLIREGGGQPKEDLAHVLLRWQQAGIEIFAKDPSALNVEPITVKRPSRFKALCYGVLAAMGLRRNSAGGFGGRVPIPTPGGHGHFG